MRSRRRRSVAVTVEALAVDMNASSSVAGVLVDGVLHLTKDVVDVDEILLRARVGHREIVLLSQGVARSRASVHGGRRSWLRHVLLCGGYGAVGDGQVSVKRHQGAANLGIRGGVNLATLGAAKEVVDHIIGALSIIAAGRSAIAKVLGASVVQGRLVEIEAIVGRGLGSIVAARMPSLMSKGGGVSSHLAIVVIIARGALGRLWPVVESTLGILRWSDKNRVIGMSLDMLLEILGSLERLATHVTLVRLQGHVNSNVRSDVVSLDSGGPARVPLTSQVEVVGALATNMTLTDVLIERLWSGKLLVTGIPPADEVIIRSCRWRSTALRSV